MAIVPSSTLPLNTARYGVVNLFSSSFSLLNSSSSSSSSPLQPNAIRPPRLLLKRPFFALKSHKKKEFFYLKFSSRGHLILLLFGQLVPCVCVSVLLWSLSLSLPSASSFQDPFPSAFQTVMDSSLFLLRRIAYCSDAHTQHKTPCS